MVSDSTMIVPETAASFTFTAVGPNIMQVEATYPFVMANRIMKMIGKASLLNHTGRREFETLQNKNRGKKMTLATLAIHTLEVVKMGFVAPAINRPDRSNKLNRRKKKGVKRSL